MKEIMQLNYSCAKIGCVKYSLSVIFIIFLSIMGIFESVKNLAEFTQT